ncbi:MAG: hypothetical protein IJ675_04460, partial [Pseudobutyrivibrio sp.]|nr:hypothetical protein [Pseudobutyrivibrio sp.]
MNNNIANKRKYIPWIFIPCVLAFVIQFLISIFVMEGGVVYAIGTFRGTTWDDMMDYVFNVMLSSVSNGLIYVLYSVVGIVLFLLC